MTRIEWCDETWNPIIGCTPCSAGCVNCYAARMHKRLAGMSTLPDYQGQQFSNVRLSMEAINNPRVLKSRHGALIFVGSMTDVFHEKVSYTMDCAVHDTMALYPKNYYLTLTKRPERIVEMTMRHYNGIGITMENVDSIQERSKYGRLLKEWSDGELMTFASIEPMVGGLWQEFDLSLLDWFDWIIVGGETGPDPRVCRIDDIARIYDWCKDQSKPFFFKQPSKKMFAGRIPADKHEDIMSCREIPQSIKDWRERCPT